MVSIIDFEVTIKGNSYSYNLAIWAYEGYAYSLQTQLGISEKALLDMIESIQMYWHNLLKKALYATIKVVH